MVFKCQWDINLIRVLSLVKKGITRTLQLMIGYETGFEDTQLMQL
jgi:hypothetical protein